MLCTAMPNDRSVSKFLMVTFPCIVLMALLLGMAAQDAAEAVQFGAGDYRFQFFGVRFVQDIILLPVVLWVFRNTSK